MLTVDLFPLEGQLLIGLVSGSVANIHVYQQMSYNGDISMDS